MPRLFTGVEIPPDTGFSLSLKRGGLPGARWIDPENYHITLRYIGDVDNYTANAVADVLERFSQSVEFTVNFTQLDVFGGRRPRSLFAGVQLSEPLARLQASQERLMQQIGLPAEGRKYTPHLTLARLRGASAEAMAHYLSHCPPFMPLSFQTTRFVLYSARDSVGGGPYRVEQSYTFENRTSFGYETEAY